ncbi:MAG: hypothetical protein ACREIA_04880 [Opitutaceae bacterium]
MDLATAIIVVSAGLTQSQSMAAPMLAEEVAGRTGVHWQVSDHWPEGTRSVVWLGLEEDLANLPPDLFAPDERPAGSGQSEGFQVVTVSRPDLSALFVIGHDVRGILYGVGHVLRKARLSSGAIVMPDDIAIITAPRFALRGHQLGYRDGANSYDAWDLEQWERYYRDLIIFGANAVELIPSLPEATPSSHFPQPPRETEVGMSELAEKYGIDLWLWYPAIAGDYADPAVANAHLEFAEGLFRDLPGIDGVFVPGGDPGHTDPDVLLPFLEKKTALLHRFHPEAQMWVSPQGFGPQCLNKFYKALESPDMDWLAGVVYGPGIRVSLAEFRARIPARYPIRSYPDITHTLGPLLGSRLSIRLPAREIRRLISKKLLSGLTPRASGHGRSDPLLARNLPGNQTRALAPLPQARMALSRWALPKRRRHAGWSVKQVISGRTLKRTRSRWPRPRLM